MWADLRTRNVATPCDAGTYADVAGLSSCKQCSGGDYSLDGATSCEMCVKGSYSSAGKSSCTSAEKGYHVSSDAATQQVACEPGTFTNEIGQPECTSCSQGYFSSSSVATTCTEESNKCGTGTYSDQRATGKWGKTRHSTAADELLASPWRYKDRRATTNRNETNTYTTNKWYNAKHV